MIKRNLILAHCRTIVLTQCPEFSGDEEAKRKAAEEREKALESERAKSPFTLPGKLLPLKR